MLLRCYVFFQSLLPILYFLLIKVSLNPLLYSFVTSLSLSFCFSSVKLDGWRLFNKIQSTLQIRDWNPIIKSATGGDLWEKVFLKILQISQKKNTTCTGNSKSGFFLRNLQNFLGNLFWRTYANGYLENTYANRKYIFFYFIFTSDMMEKNIS